VSSKKYSIDGFPHAQKHARPNRKERAFMPHPKRRCRVGAFFLGQGVDQWSRRSVESMNGDRLVSLRLFLYCARNLASHFRGADGELGGFR
jgi:hypothetical protein